MGIEKKDFKKILDFLNLNGLRLNDIFLPKPIGIGQSNPTFLIQDNKLNLKVLRMQPPGDLVRGAHRVDREFLVLKALREKNFIVPEPIIHCDDTSIVGRQFYVMEFIDGDIFDDPFIKGKSSIEKISIYHSLAESLGRLHSFDTNDLNLPFKKNHGFMKRNLSVWYNQIFNEDNKPDKDIEKVFNTIIDDLPENGDLSLLHGDYKLDNVVVNKNNNCIAILDWELSSFGEPMADISFQMINWLIPSGVLYGIGGDWKKNGIPSSETFLGWYEKSYGKTVDLLSLRNACIFSLIKLFCILKGIENRINQGNAFSEDADLKAKAAPNIKNVLMNAFESNPKDLIIS
jgi:aminoglycoside phosphotransferase (APT) family kinase protein